MNTETLHHLVGIFQGLCIIGGSWWGYSYYFGKLNFQPEIEKKRKIKVEKFGWILLPSCIIGSLVGILIILLSLYKITIASH